METSPGTPSRSIPFGTDEHDGTVSQLTPDASLGWATLDWGGLDWNLLKYRRVFAYPFLQ